MLQRSWPIVRLARHRSPPSSMGRQSVNRQQHGVTLIELMIVVAIIAVLAMIALGAYQRYVKEAQIAKVISHYDDAVRAVKSEFAKRVAQLSHGQNLVAVDSSFVISGLVNPQGVTAPLGGPAYLDGDPDPATGAIGILVTGGGRAGTEIVTIKRPAFLEDVTAASVSIFANTAR
jgi:prepilin-type N-terminal cleavage/methylation domain-containing protein